MSRKIAIVGLHGLTLSPHISGINSGEYWHDAELWTINDWHNTLAAAHYRPFRVYNMHDRLDETIEMLHPDWTVDWLYGKGYDAVHQAGAQIWLTEPHPRFPYARIYPYFDIRRELDVADWFFSCGIVYMLAHGLAEGCREFTIRCVSLTGDDEYHWQAIGVLYAIRVAERMGATVDLPTRFILEQRFTPEDFAALESGGDAARGLYRLNLPYHVTDRNMRQQVADAALKHHTNIVR